MVDDTARFRFAFSAPLAPLSWLFGATPWTSGVELTEQQLTVRYGPWVLRTPVDNLADASRSGPYTWWRVAGPARLSMSDRGITFATNLREGVCIRFVEPVPAIRPRGREPHHPAVTVTVDRPDDLVAAVLERRERTVR